MTCRPAVIQERARIARELHDTVLQAFTGATLLLQRVADDLHRAESPEATTAARALDGIIGLTSGALTDTRRAVLALRTSVVHDVSLSARLETLLHEVLDSSGVEFHFQQAGTAVPLSEDAEEQTMLICRESLWNVVRHANARHVTVTLAHEHSSLRLTITDDGRGFIIDPHVVAGSSHFGLIGMRERALDAGGELAIRTTAGRGTAIVLAIPYVAGPRHPIGLAKDYPFGERARSVALLSSVQTPVRMNA